ncbi:MAG: hypothetical protein ABI990_01935 [Actinomycetota bacterium]
MISDAASQTVVCDLSACQRADAPLPTAYQHSRASADTQHGRVRARSNHVDHARVIQPIEKHRERRVRLACEDLPRLGRFNNGFFRLTRRNLSDRGRERGGDHGSISPANSA